MAQRYLIANGVMQTTVAFVPVSTGTAIKTLLQLKPLAILKIVEWGISFDGSAAATPGKVELIETDVAATVSALADADVTKAGDCVGDAEAFSTFASLGTTATGYTASAEGSITSVRNLDSPKFIAPTNQYEKQFPLGREPVVQKNKFARIRVTFGTAVNAYAYMIVEV